MQKPGPTARVKCGSIASAESAKCESIPNVTFIVRDLVTLEERTQLILKSNATMMLFLIVDITL